MKNSTSVAIVMALALTSLFASSEALNVSLNLNQLLGGLIYGLLKGLLGAKGIVVAVNYSTVVNVYANVAASIAIGIPSIGILTPVTAIIGSVLPLNTLLVNVLGSTAVINVRATVDVQVKVDVFAEVDVNFVLPTGYCLCNVSNATVVGLFGGELQVGAQVGLNISVSADVEVAATLITPVLAIVENATNIGILKLSDNGEFIPIDAIFDPKTGRVVADLGVKIQGVYIFVAIKAAVGL